LLSFIGVGLEQSPTLEAIELLKECDIIYYETYTSPVINSDVFKTLSDWIVQGNKKEIETVKREFVEDGRHILQEASKSKVALVCSGDPLVATTHQDLRVRAIRQGIETRVLHGSSIICAIGGELGLSSYSFGKTVTMTRSPMQYTAYLTIHQNLLRGLHTILLLEWDESSNFFLSPKDAIANLTEAEKDLKYGIITSETLILAISRIGQKRSNPRITCSNFSEAQSVSDFGLPPITLVIPGKLHFTEIEALSVITKKSEDYFVDNSKNIQRLGQTMLAKYSQKTLAALKRARDAASKKDSAERGRKYESVFENVELYTSDSLRFLNEGKEELAILSIGYAEGLLDSLRFSGELEFEW
jgi:diphthine synthase